MRLGLSFLAPLLVSLAECKLPLVVPLTENVSVKGVEVKAGGRTVHRYGGIPYVHRSALLVHPEPLVYPTTGTHVIDGTTAGAVCPQAGDFKVPQEAKPLLDVLMDTKGAVVDAMKGASLDIHVAPTDAMKRIVIYIHGGGMDSGARNQGLNNADRVLQHDAIGNDTVWFSLGYSLGPLGFWTRELEDGKIETNAALYELIAGIKWIHTYAQKFNGNVKDVTVIGHSAGACLVQLIHFILRDWAKFGFAQQPFHKMAIMSGTAALFEPVTIPTALLRQKMVTEQTPCKDLPLTEQFACLQKLSGETLIEAAKNANVAWGPVRDGVDIMGSSEEHLSGGHFMDGVTVFVTTGEHDCSLFCIRMKEGIQEEGHKFWEKLGHGESIALFERDYPYSAYKDCKYTAAIRAATEGIFGSPAIQSVQLYRDAGLEVYHHEFRFVLEKLNGMMARTVARGLSLYLRFDIVAAFDILLGLGTFHGLEQVVLFDTVIQEVAATRITSPHTVSIGTLSSKGQVATVLAPFFSFLKNGKVVTEQLIPEPKASARSVNVFRAVSKLYTGELPITAFNLEKELEAGEPKAKIEPAENELKEKGVERL